MNQLFYDFPIWNLVYLERRRSSPLRTIQTIDGGLANLASTNKVVIDVSLPRHDLYIKFKVIKKKVKRWRKRPELGSRVYIKSVSGIIGCGTWWCNQVKVQPMKFPKVLYPLRSFKSAFYFFVTIFNFLQTKMWVLDLNNGCCHRVEPFIFLMPKSMRNQDI